MIELHEIPQKFEVLHKLPAIVTSLNMDEIPVVDFLGLIYGLDEKHKAKIEEIERDMKCKVFGIVNTNTEFGNLTSYLLVTESDITGECISIYESTPGVVNVIAYVVNRHIEEVGSVGLQQETFFIKRVY